MSGASQIVAASWFVDNGIMVFPIKFKAKEPAVRSWDDFTCSRDQAAGFKNYGVRLESWFGVIDTDTNESEAWANRCVPGTPFMVKTARGIHRYYRLPRPTPKFIHRDGMTIEFRNAGQYVLGPGSTHPSGAVYDAWPWSWNLTDVTMFPSGDFIFDDRPGFGNGVGNIPGAASSGIAFEFPEVCYAGERHDALFKLLRSFKALGNDYASTRILVGLANTHRCSPPLPDNPEFDRWCRRAWNNPDRPITLHEPPLGQTTPF
jgi:hypothetical protein